ncbi:transporter [Nocardia inohanensis]|uniref:transporter n=1 Tax=Nocardia inohanensis TaxID=209246 RepID=UPI00082F4376|nr:transporter [Nocardia inohanensis]
MDVKIIALLVVDLWMVYAGFVYGTRFIRKYSNYLLGIEWIAVAVSGSNVVLLGMIGLDHSSPSYHLMLFLDAFSRSFGITLILVLGMLKVTHRYFPTPAVDVAVFALATVTGVYLSVYVQPITTPWAIFYVVMAALASVFMLYVAKRLWDVDERRHAVWVVIATVCAAAIAGTYDFVHIPGDDEDHTVFYTIALAVWALELTVFYHAYSALDRHNEQTGTGQDSLIEKADK